MMDIFKKTDKSFLIKCGILLIIPIIIIIILAIIRGCSSRGNNYSSYEQKMTTKASTYFKQHKLLPSKEGKEVVVTLDELMLDGLKSPNKYLKDSTCTGSVTVQKNGSEYFYTPYLDCSEYKTDYLVNHIKKDITTKESGLYQINNEYIYKGNKVNNYLSFFGNIYRIIKIDSNGNLRLIKEQRQDRSIQWDDKYNSSKEDNVGINEYYNSYIYDQVWSDYNNIKLFNKEVKKHMIGHTVCLDKKDENDLSMNESCEKPLHNQYISIPTIYDYELASYDQNCKQIGDGACSNFNYLDDVLTSTWTVNTSASDDYSVYYLAGSYIDTQSANNYKNYYWVISISGNELYISGSGTEKDPYIIK